MERECLKLAYDKEQGAMSESFSATDPAWQNIKTYIGTNVRRGFKRALLLILHYVKAMNIMDTEHLPYMTGTEHSDICDLAFCILWDRARLTNFM
jgi:hypothetical protein